MYFQNIKQQNNNEQWIRKNEKTPAVFIKKQNVSL